MTSPLRCVGLRRVERSECISTKWNAHPSQPVQPAKDIEVKMDEITNILQDASNRLHLTRERAIEYFDRSLSNSSGCPGGGEEKILAVLNDKVSIGAFQTQLCDSVLSPNWEGRLGTLRLAAIWISKGNPDDSFLDLITNACDELLEDEEVRVRMAVGDVIRALSSRRGVGTWQALGDRITSSIVANMVKNA